MNFDSIIGQEEIKAALENAVSCSRVGHAYVFSGPRGIGKKSVARIFAKLLLCQKGGSTHSCGECMACKLFQEGSNPDFRMLGQDGGSIGVDEIRGIQSDIVVRPLYSKRKVYIIADADMMTVQAQNCFLKILEEPPRYAVMILTTSNYEALLETIRSRTLRYNFKKNTFDEVLAFLKQKFGSCLEGADFIASYADGVIGTAQELAGSDEFISLRDRVIELLFEIHRSKLGEIFDIYEFFEKNKSSIDVIFDIMLLVYRDLAVLKKTGNENMLINSDKKDIIFNNAGAFTMQKLIKNIETIEQTRRNIKQNANYQLSIEVMLMKLQEGQI